MNINPGTKIEFEGKKFRYCKSDIDVRFDTYVLKSKGNVMTFSKEGYVAQIITAKFPNGYYGYGYKGTALLDKQLCYCHGVLDNKTFKTEFEAQCAAILYVLKSELPSDWHRHFIRIDMQNFVNPKTLF
jgi:hypothetical protein